MDDLIVLLVLLGIFLPLVLLVAAIKRPTRWRWIGLAVIYITLDLFLTSYGLTLQKELTKGLHWNWLGKFGSIALGIAVLWRWPEVRREAGAVWAQNRGTIIFSFAATLALGTASFWLAHSDPRTPFNLETILYQATMPSVSEEIAFRGILLCLLSRAFGDMGTIKGLRISWGVPLVVVFFGLGHAVFWANGGLHLSMESLLYTGGVGAVIMAVRISSGSLVFPMIMHTVFNLIAEGLPMLR